MKAKLHPYQEQTATRLLENIPQSGAPTLYLELTGYGRTTTIAAMLGCMKRIPRTIWLMSLSIIPLVVDELEKQEVECVSTETEPDNTIWLTTPHRARRYLESRDDSWDLAILGELHSGGEAVRWVHAYLKGAKVPFLELSSGCNPTILPFNDFTVIRSPFFERNWAQKGTGS